MVCQGYILSLTRGSSCFGQPESHRLLFLGKSFLTSFFLGRIKELILGGKRRC